MSLFFYLSMTPCIEQCFVIFTWLFSHQTIKVFSERIEALEEDKHKQDHFMQIMQENIDMLTQRLNEKGVDLVTERKLDQVIQKTMADRLPLKTFLSSFKDARTTMQCFVRYLDSCLFFVMSFYAPFSLAWLFSLFPSLILKQSLLRDSGSTT